MNLHQAIIEAKFPVIGITGGIACGKSWVCRRLAELGCEVVDADIVARVVTAPGTEGLARILEAFGAEVMIEHEDHLELNRTALADIVFKDREALKTLNGLIHPLMEEAFINQIEGNILGKTMVLDSALWVETANHEIFDQLWVVSTSAELQLSRLMKRNSLEQDDAKRRIAAQMPLADKLEYGDRIIWSENGKEAEQKEFLVNLLKVFHENFQVYRNDNIIRWYELNK